MVQAQNRRLRSANGPDTSRKPKAAASPTPVTTPTTSPVAPNEASSGPVIERAPSYTTSASRPTTPNTVTNRHALNAGRVAPMRLNATSPFAPTRC
ncbi:Uncharacterised protein [Mycobacterium tuberculosis]|uniref:Uncharacterized protein n=1 Tax=Mycobacterium tuberculosis TaxID=1773 RepID=A0A654TR81_MYCTX|nr:Uncharacterised protein [Mycobacterium tuberculosis]CFR76512.1 Uncharacterised protein [Mycobacterium tuberculosis]CKS30710.1 Uncharacterised protein [Mycobacterium tuberculosis]CKS31610.1 Uncharacterised protein [Mycobacterium tuberculosis]CKU17674.1 Uncharacterised protein [Mycobacterium tuberculosis]